jgi:hypothetical protein
MPTKKHKKALTERAENRLYYEATGNTSRSRGGWSPGWWIHTHELKRDKGPYDTKKAALAAAVDWERELKLAPVY